LLVRGTIAGNIIQGATVSGAPVTGTTTNFTSGVFASLPGIPNNALYILYPLSEFRCFLWPLEY